VLLHHPILLENPARIDGLARALAKVVAAFAPGAPSPSGRGPG
jgi:hypothetical protein